MTDRPDWDSYFLQIAGVVATRSTCPRKHVGAVIIKDRQILSTGYNGSVSGAPHCDDVGCTIENRHCIATVHAEVNAICAAARHGVSLDGATLYVTANPCLNCMKTAVNAGIKTVVNWDTYTKVDYSILTGSGVEVILVEPPKKLGPSTTPVD